MEPKIRAEIEALARDARALHEQAGKLADRLDALIQSGPETEEPLKRADGRMTDSGIAAINAAFSSGATVTEVAHKFGITVSAASNRRKIWQMSEHLANA